MSIKTEEKLIEFKTRLTNLYFRETLDSKLIQMMNDDLKGFMSSDTAAIFSLIDGYSVCVDVGANVGALTCSIAKKAKKVYAIEPVKGTIEILKKNIEANNLKNIEVLECGMGDVNTKMVVDPAEVSSSSFLVANIMNIEQNTEIVKVVRLDDAISEKIDFIKIDVQGMDALVVKGAEKTIEKFKPIFFIEYWAANKNIGKKELRAYKKMLKGYNFYINIKKDFSVGRKEFIFAKLPSLFIMLFSTGTQDFYAIPKERKISYVSSGYLVLFLLIKKIKTIVELAIVRKFLILN